MKLVTKLCKYGKKIHNNFIFSTRHLSNGVFDIILKAQYLNLLDKVKNLIHHSNAELFSVFFISRAVNNQVSNAMV